MNKRATIFRIGDVVQTPTGQRGVIEDFDADGRAEVRYYNQKGVLMSSSIGEVCIWPHFLKFALTPRQLRPIHT